LRRVHIAASSTCTLALTCLLQDLEREQTWETLARLLLFPHIAAPARGGKATRSSSTQKCRLNCLAAILEPFGELIARIRRQAATDGPRTRAQTMPQHQRWLPLRPKPRALLAEGEPGRALQLLTSDGVCYAADPVVLSRLRKLHPQAEGPNLEALLPEDLPDVTPSMGVLPAPANRSPSPVLSARQRGGALRTTAPTPGGLPQLGQQCGKGGRPGGPADLGHCDQQRSPTWGASGNHKIRISVFVVQSRYIMWECKAHRREGGREGGIEG